MTKTPKSVTLVIGSGGIKCAAAIGLWKVLKENDIQLNGVVGCSGGSLYGALIANHSDIKEMEERSYQLWTSDLMQGYITNLKASQDGSLKFNERSGLVNDSALNKTLQTVFGDLTLTSENPAQNCRHRHADRRQSSSFGRHDFDAVRASSAIPIIFPPWEVDGRLLIDGAASNPLPIDIAIQDGADIIIAMGFPLSYRTRFRSMTAVQEQLNSIYMNNILNATYAFYNLAHHAEIFTILPEFEGAISMFDVDKVPHVIERGEQATRELIPHIRRLLEKG
jgi:NTE family protein